MWIIDNDLINDYVEERPINREGAHSSDFDPIMFMEMDRVQWRVKDDDGEIYYEGRMTKERLEDFEGRAFGPLDFAMADAGATTMEYLENEEWVQL